jgi:nickel-dependent lactate racemase
MNNHSACNVDNPMARPGILDGNPVHEEFTEAARRVKLDFILNVVLDKDKRIINAFAGDSFKAHEEGCGFVRSICEVSCKRSDIVITSNSGYPLDINLYQSIKGMDTASAAAKDRAVIIISTECSEGIGHGGFLKVYDTAESLEAALENLRSEKVRIHDQWGAQVMLRLSQKYTIIVVTNNIDKHILKKMYVEHASKIQEALDMAFKLKGKDSQVNIIAEGPMIIPVAK